MTGQPGEDRAVAMVGASDRGFWTYWIAHNLQRYGYTGTVWGVNPRLPKLEIPVVESLAKVPARLDAVVIAVNPAACAGVLEEAAGLGVRDVVVLTNGFAEAGDDEGRALQDRLVELSRQYSVRLYGPNGIGFADFQNRFCPLGAPIPDGVTVGDVDVLSQSGSLLLMVLQALAEEEVGVDWAVSLGNAASIDLARGIEMALDRPGDGGICGYVETLGRSADDIARLAGALDRAAEAGRQVALVKVGASETGARVAQAHTASITGDREVVGAFLARHGAVLADDIEDLARFVNVHRHLARARRGPGVGVAVIEGSGGSAAMTADLAGTAGVPLAEFSAHTASELARVAGPGSFVANPVDLTATPQDPAEVERALGSIYDDPAVGAVLVPFSVPFPLGEGDHRDIHRVILLRHARLGRQFNTPVVVSAVVNQGWSEWIRTYAQDHADVLVVRGVSPTIRALAHIFRQPAGAFDASPGAAPGTAPGAAPGAASSQASGQQAPGGTLDIAESRRVLEAIGVPCTRAEILRDSAAAAAAAESLRLPVVVKAIVPGLVHKEQWGGVRLGIASAAALTDAVGQMLDLIRGQGITASVLVEEMVWGRELLLGVRRTPNFGPVATFGLGGFEPESRKNQITSLLPFSACDLDLISGFMSAHARLGPTAQAAVLEVVQLIAREFTEGALSGYQLVEINPLIATADGVVAADAVLET
jgi:acyl-CoA synthetase (NDP forming)